MTGTTISRYAVLEKLGEGGMGEVYKARDLRLDRFVALKLLPAEFSSFAEIDSSFEREALAISSLNHPHIATIYDFDEADGNKFLVLEFLPGGTLRSKLTDLDSTGQSLPPETAVRYAVEIAEALAHAHRWGVLHLDLKPENVMFTADGAVKLTDFGLAQWRGERPGELDARGTPAYVSPEQAEGKEVDYRSDIFSFGIVLFEMLAGEVPFSAEDTTEQIYRIIHSPAPPLKSVRPDLPQELCRIVESTLEKNPDRRYQSADLMSSDLQVVQGELGETVEEPQGGSGLLGSLSSWLTGARREPPPAGAPARATAEHERQVGPTGVSIAVLPFVNMTRDPQTDYLSDGLTEELINALTKLRELRVVAPTTAFQFKGKSQDTLLIREKLGVDAILDGSVRKAGNTLRVTAKLINAADGSYLWSETYEREMEDVFAIQQQIAEVIVHELRIQLVDQRRPPLVKQHTESLDAYQLYLKGRFYWNKQTPLALNRCIRCFEEAVERDPRYALAHAGLADAYNLIGTWAVRPPHEVMRKAKQAALQARDIDESLAEVHTSLGFVRAVYDWNWREAKSEYDLALDLNPGYATARHAYAMSWLAPMGRLEEAIKEMQRAQSLNPLSLFINANLGLALHLARQFDRAVEQHERTLDLEPDYYLTHLYLGWTYTQQGKLNEAVQALERSRALSGDSPFIAAALGQAYAGVGKTDEARQVLSDLIEKGERRYVSPLGLAGIQLALGEFEKGFTNLAKACEERSSWLILSNVDPAFDALRPDPRFQEIVRKIGLQEAAPS